MWLLSQWWGSFSFVSSLCNLLLFGTLGGLIYGAPSDIEICLMNTLQRQELNALKNWKWKLLSCVRLFMTHGLYSPWNSPGQNTGVGSCSRLQGIFPTQGLKPGLWVADGFFTTEPPEKPKDTGVGSLSLLQGIFPTQGLNLGLPHCGQTLYHLKHQENPTLRGDLSLLLPHT